MKASLNGVLIRAAERLKKTRDANHLEWPLLELLDSLRQLRREPHRVGEFFEFWTDSDPDGKVFDE